MEPAVQEIMGFYTSIRPRIESRLKEFEEAWHESDEDIFAELVFCIFTPQSKARSCWAAVERLIEKDLLMNGSAQEIAAEINGVRFHNTKAERVVRARYQFFQGAKSLRSTISSFDEPKEAREWLVQNVNGLGYKEASHFLRNIGMGAELAILDRHILKNLVALGIIEEVPGGISPGLYLKIEELMANFCKRHNIRMDHLDMILWYRETGRIYK